MTRGRTFATRTAPRVVLFWLAATGAHASWTPPSDVSGPGPAPTVEAPLRVSAELWRELGSPGARRAAELTEKALLHVREASRQMRTDWATVCERTMTMRLSSTSEAAARGRMRALRQLLRQALSRRAHLDNALARLRRAIALDPDNPEALHALAAVLMAWEEPGPLWTCEARRRDREATEALERLRQLHPHYHASEVSFELGVLLTRSARFEQASAAYADAIALSLDERESPLARGNLAEVTMLSGRLEAALAHYRRALSLGTGGRQYLLSLWGMAVTFDRLGEHATALSYASKALGGDADRLRILRSDGVFFVPKHEVHYYEALGHEALSKRDDIDATERSLSLERAAESWRAYLSGASATDRFAAAAEDNLRAVEAARQALSARAGDKAKNKAKSKAEAPADSEAEAGPP